MSLTTRRMTRVAVCGAAVLLMTRSAVIVGQAPDFSGTWKLDAQQSRISADAGFAGLIAAGAPDTLYVTQPANGTLIVESQINESHVRIYTPRAKSTTPVGQGGSITMTSRWDGRTLISEGRRESPSGTSTLVTQVKEVIALSADGRTLAIDVTTTGSANSSVSSLVYTRNQAVEPCQSWPTPCKGR
jgi:hypothetical protein